MCVLLRNEENVLLLHNQKSDHKQQPEEYVIRDDVDGDLGAFRLREERSLRPGVITAVHKRDTGNFNYAFHARSFRRLDVLLSHLFLVVLMRACEYEFEELPD